MLASPDTEQLGLRGLFLEAQREGEQEAARQFAERALKLNPKLDWPVEALFDLQCRAGDWQGALDTLAIARRSGLIDKTVANRRRAVLLTAQAQAAEDTAADKALELALEAHRLAPDLVPAAAIAGRILASQGNTPRAARVLLKTWRLAPHPDLAAAYAYARPGDSPRDRLNRVRHLGPPHAARQRGADRARHHGHRGARVGRGAQGARAAAGRPPDAARRHPDGAHRGRAARPCRPRARMAGARRQCAARSRLDGRRRRVRPLGAGVAGDRRARCLPLARAGRGAAAAPCSAPRSRRWPASAPAPSPRIEHADAAKPAAAFPPPRRSSPSSAPVSRRRARQDRRLPPSRCRRAEPSASAAAGRGRVAADARRSDARRTTCGERIRLAAQRAIAASRPRRGRARAAKPATQKPPAREAGGAEACAGKAPTPQPAARKSGEPKIFVPPRAPDDPGPESRRTSASSSGPCGPSGAKA